MNVSKTVLQSLAIAFSLLIFCASLLGSVHAQNIIDSAKTEPTAESPATIDELLARYPAGSIDTMEAAKRASDDVHKVRAVLDARFASEQNACFTKFFVTACVAEAKERHRAALAQVQPIDIEANKFKRRAKVQEREKVLAEKRDKEASGLLNQAKKQENQTTDQSAEPKQESKASAADRKTKNNMSGDRRAEEHQAAVKKRDAAEAEEAKQRARNIAAYEKKVQESEARQRKIAAKKAEKERERIQRSKDALKSK